MGAWLFFSSEFSPAGLAAGAASVAAGLSAGMRLLSGAMLRLEGLVARRQKQRGR